MFRRYLHSFNPFFEPFPRHSPHFPSQSNSPTALSQWSPQRPTQRVKSLDLITSPFMNPNPTVNISVESNASKSQLLSVDNNQLDNPLVAYNRKLDFCRRNSRYLAIKGICEEMQQTKIKPDLQTYNILLSSYEPLGDVPSSLKLLDDMALAGITPDLTTYHILLRTCASAPRISQDAHFRELIFDLIHNANLKLNTITHECYLEALVANGELERSIEYIENLRKKNIQPTVKMYDNLIQSAISLDISEEAFKLLKMAEEDQLPLYVNLYFEVLRGCSDDYNIEGVHYCWNKIIEKNFTNLDEGACIDALNVAARFGKPQLAAQIIVYLTEHRKVSLESHHLEPLLEAFIGDNDLKQAMDMLSIMRSTGLEVNIKTASPIIDVIHTDPEMIDKAYFALESLRKEGKPIDIVAFNAIIIACRDIRPKSRVGGVVNSDDPGTNKRFTSNADLHRAVETYKAAESLGVKPDVHTFNALLNVCVAAQHRELGEQFWKEMKEKNIRPTIESYRRMIFLACSQISDDYEDAFIYLEEMKSQNMLPPPSVYERIVKKCVQHDDARAKIALEEMNNFGYKPSPALRDLLRYEQGSRNLDNQSFDRQRRRSPGYYEEAKGTGQESPLKAIDTKIELNDLDQFFSAITKSKITRK
ncbi:159_t:CDS:2 [Diversispora eburnea]|uniref:159_t:CDS:1 n=1 Tax=Diversispora eburnea TaxID=1213867 RepID=A0A9N9FHC7_9GLOM|nr:159_t:CDS:2 [Diversispora eburnea]